MSPLSLTAMTFATLLAGTAAASAQATPAAPANPLGGQFTTEAEAKNRCPADAVVWVNKDTKVYHLSSDRHYGKTKQGFFMCRQEANSLGFRAPTTSAKSALASPAPAPAPAAR